MNLDLEFSEFAEYLTDSERLVRKSSLSEDHSLYEFFSTLFLPSSASIWRVSVAYVPSKSDSNHVERIHEGFIEFHRQCNVTRLFIFSDLPLSEGLERFLSELDVVFINLTTEIGPGLSLKDYYPQLERLFYPSITSEELAQSSAPQKLSESDAHPASKEFFYNVLQRTVNDHRSVLRLLSYYLAIPERDDSLSIPNVRSTDFAGSFFASNEQSGEQSNSFIYPNRFYIFRVLHNSQLLISQLSAMRVGDDLAVVSNALSVVCTTMIDVYLNVLYGINLQQSMTKVHESLTTLSHQDCISLLLDSFEARAPDEQMWAIDAALQLNGPSEIVVKAAIEGANSSVKVVAVHCIRILGNFSVREAVPLLQTLSADRSKTIQRAAQQALKLIEAKYDAWRDNAESIPIDDLSEPIEGALIDHDTLISTYSLASRNSFFPGPNGTTIHVQLFDGDKDGCIAITTHEDGTRDMASGKRFGMVTHIVGTLTGAIKIDPDRLVGMGEAAIFHGDGSVERINLSSDDNNDKT